MLRGDSEKDRLAAAAFLGQIGKDALPALMEVLPTALRNNGSASTWPAAERTFAVVAVDVMRAIVANDGGASENFVNATMLQ